MPQACRVKSRCSCRTLSNAFDRSMKTAVVYCFLSRAWSQSSRVARRRSEQECEARNPNWNLLSSFLFDKNAETSSNTILSRTLERRGVGWQRGDGSDKNKIRAAVIGGDNNDNRWHHCKNAGVCLIADQIQTWSDNETHRGTHDRQGPVIRKRFYLGHSTDSECELFLVYRHSVYSVCTDEGEGAGECINLPQISTVVLGLSQPSSHLNNMMPLFPQMLLRGSFLPPLPLPEPAISLAPLYECLWHFLSTTMMRWTWDEVATINALCPVGDYSLQSRLTAVDLPRGLRRK